MPELLWQLTFHLAIPTTTYYRKYHKYHYLQCSNNILVNDHIGIASQNWKKSFLPLMHSIYVSHKLYVIICLLESEPLGR